MKDVAGMRPVGRVFGHHGADEFLEALVAIRELELGHMTDTISDSEPPRVEEIVQDAPERVHISLGRRSAFHAGVQLRGGERCHPRVAIVERHQVRARHLAQLKVQQDGRGSKRSRILHDNVVALDVVVDHLVRVQVRQRVHHYQRVFMPS